MTNGWVDIKNADMMLVMGGNPAENHPCGFKWAIEAKRTRNAPLIVVDPRYTRTAAVSDLFVQIRAGSDIALLGAIINYTLQNDRVNREYLVNYTNAAFIVKEGFQLPEEGLYSGYNAETHSYDKSTWNYEQGGNLTPKTGAVAAAAQHTTAPASPALTKPAHAAPALSGMAAASGSPPAMPENIAYDTSLQHPRSVYQLMKKQYSRYTPELVERITGIPKEQILKVADLFTSIRKDGDVKKVGTIIYAVGWTQHSSGTQTIRAAALLQLLLGNIGRAGGGVNALRGHSNIQGATDMAGIFDLLPGYLKVPVPADTDLNAYLARTTTKPAKPAEWASFNYYSNTPKFAVSLLKSLYGDAATKENGFAFDYLPKVDRNYSWVVR
jgi:formate dehydrogenase major subunit